jgi:hypothetical protein
MQKLTLPALFLIAACALSMGASAQNTYKCGNSYSQTPCPGAVALDTRDPRDGAQKTQADLATVRDAKAAEAMAAARRQQEKTDLQANTPQITSPTPAAGSNDGAPSSTPPRQLKKRKGTTYFTAQVPGEKKKKKTGKKKVPPQNGRQA